MARQLPLDLPHAPATERDDFVVGEANRAAVLLVDAWPQWPERGVFLTGPSGSGKSHLAAIWRRQSGARLLAAAGLEAGGVEDVLAGSALVVEDIHDGPVDETALFHLLNLARERRIALLFTSRSDLDGLGLTLPDLVSRIKAMHRSVLGAPDDDLLVRVLAKLFSDRQLAVDPGVLGYLASRMERSFEAANLLTAWIDQEGLAKGRPVTKRLAGEVMDHLAAVRDHDA